MEINVGAFSIFLDIFNSASRFIDLIIIKSIPTNKETIKPKITKL